MTADQTTKVISAEDILRPRIPGCPRHKKKDNLTRNHSDEPQPEMREAVEIPFSSVPTYEAAAIFYSYLAYPDREDGTQRNKFRIALARWAVLERGKYEPWWDDEPSIMPKTFSQDEKLFRDTWRLGSRQLSLRCNCAFRTLLPQFEEC